MSATDESTMTRVVSPDGTEIAFWTSGEGPPFVVVRGAPANHTRWCPLLPYLAPHATVHAVDRRGRGASGDAPDYDIAREFEDVAAVVGAVAETSGSSVDVYGHSYGRFVVFGAATLTSNIGKLVLYEGWPVPEPSVFALRAGVEEKLNALLAEGEREALLETVMREVVMLSDEELEALRSMPSWPGRVAASSEVYAQTLTGVGDRSHLLACGVDLTTHIRDVTNLFFYEDLSDVVLVGHSYAGMVITGVAAVAPERLRQLIYLDAYLPDEGESEVELWPAEMRAEIEADAEASRGLRPPPLPELMGITDPAMASWARERITPHPMTNYTEPVPRGGPGSATLPRAYISCTEGPLTNVFGRFADKARSSGWVVREIATGHGAMLIDPDAVAKLLLELADAA